MFTGIVERSLKVAHVVDLHRARQITLDHFWPDLRQGESVAVNGVCLTVAAFDASMVRFDVIAETLEKTNLGQLRPGDFVHVERALKLGDRFDGHFVQGHVDGVGTILDQRDLPGEWRTRIGMPDDFAPYLVPKGSICVDGISLTLAKVDRDAFEVALIPTTLEITRLGRKPVGATVNLEADMIAKTIVRFLELRQATHPR